MKELETGKCPYCGADGIEATDTEYAMILTVAADGTIMIFR